MTEPFRGYFQAEDYCFFGAEGIPEGTAIRELAVSSLITAMQTGPGVVTVRGVAWSAARVTG